jgi:hypothetical protein
MASAPFAIVRTTAGRGLICLSGDQVDVYDASVLDGEPGALVTGNGLELCLRGSHQSARVTITCTGEPGGADATAEPVGVAMLDLPTGNIVVSTGDSAVYGPFPVSAGVGLYRVEVFGGNVGLDGYGSYLAVFTRLGDSPDEEDEDD